MVPVNQLAINIILFIDLRKLIHFREKRDYYFNYFIQQHGASRDVINSGRVKTFRFQHKPKGCGCSKKQAPQGAANVCKPSGSKCTSSKFKAIYSLKAITPKYCKLKTCPVILNSLLCAYILRDPGTVSVGGKKSKLASKKSGEEKSRTLRPEDGMHRLAKTVEREGNRLL